MYIDIYIVFPYIYIYTHGLKHMYYVQVHRYIDPPSDLKRVSRTTCGDGRGPGLRESDGWITMVKVRPRNPWFMKI